MIVYIIFGSALFMLYWHWDLSSADAQSETGASTLPVSALAAAESSMLSFATKLSRTVFEWASLLPSPLINLIAPFWSLLRTVLSSDSQLSALIASAVFGDMPDPDASLNSLQDPNVDAPASATNGDARLNASVGCPMRQSPLLLAVFCHVAFFITHMLYSQFYLRRLIAALFPFEAAPGTSVSIIQQHTTLEPYQPQSSASSTDAGSQEQNSEPAAQADMYVFTFSFFRMAFGNPLDLNLFEMPGSVTPSCPICYIEYTANDFVRRLSCRHFYHDGCISAWLQQKRLWYGVPALDFAV